MRMAQFICPPWQCRFPVFSRQKRVEFYAKEFRERDPEVWKALLAGVEQHFAVNRSAESLGAVQVDVITPVDGVLGATPAISARPSPADLSVLSQHPGTNPRCAIRISKAPIPKTRWSPQPFRLAFSRIFRPLS